MNRPVTRVWAPWELKVIAAPHHGRRGIIPPARRSPILPQAARPGRGRRLAGWGLFLLVLAAAAAWGLLGQR